MHRKNWNLYWTHSFSISRWWVIISKHLLYSVTRKEKHKNIIINTSFFLIWRIKVFINETFAFLTQVGQSFFTHRLVSPSLQSSLCFSPSWWGSLATQCVGEPATMTSSGRLLEMQYFRTLLRSSIFTRLPDYSHAHQSLKNADLKQIW